MDYLVTFEDGSEAYLAHYGVKGMKKGIRKQKPIGQGRPPAGLEWRRRPEGGPPKNAVWKKRPENSNAQSEQEGQGKKPKKSKAEISNRFMNVLKKRYPNMKGARIERKKTGEQRVVVDDGNKPKVVGKTDLLTTGKFRKRPNKR